MLIDNGSRSNRSAHLNGRHTRIIPTSRNAQEAEVTIRSRRIVIRLWYSYDIDGRGFVEISYLSARHRQLYQIKQPLSSSDSVCGSVHGQAERRIHFLESRPAISVFNGPDRRISSWRPSSLVRSGQIETHSRQISPRMRCAS